MVRARTRGWDWQLGKRVWEVTPTVRWDKGHAALMMWKHFGRPFLVTIGDEEADEPMILAARRRGAVRTGRWRTFDARDDGAGAAP